MPSTSPIGTVNSYVPDGEEPPEETWRKRALQGRAVFGVDVKIVDDQNRELPWDGVATGELKVRGPWVCSGYFGLDASAAHDADGWFATGDVAAIDADGYVHVTDRAKDVIKSGGEWISSVDMENLLMAHPAVQEAAVIAVADTKWGERPLACVVLKPGEKTTVEDLRTFLATRVAKWWLPERWAFINEVPKTSVGKFDKKVLRARFAKGEIPVVEAKAVPAP